MPRWKHGFSPTRTLVGFSLCVASAVSFSTPASAACQAGTPGCVLPVRDAPAPPPPPDQPPPAIIEDGGFFDGSGWLLALLGLAAIIAAVLALSGDDDDDEVPISP